jgi:nucleoside-diphosphate-sugar epimerase
MREPQLHVVFGAGQIGAPLARLLVGRGHAVRVVSRSGSTGGVAGVQVVRGDAADARLCREAIAGAGAAYHCMNPAYDTALWARVLPRIQENLVGAAGRAGARLVVLDNLYALGRAGGRPMDEDTPASPCSRKGEIRARLGEALLDAHRRGDVRAVAGRASDFFGPRGEQTLFNGRFWRRVLGGRSGQVLGDPDKLHTYHYVDDVAAALAALGEAPDDALGRAWMLPCAPAETTRALIGHFAAAIGRRIPVERVPRLVTRLLGVAWPLMRELDEMVYQWDEPFVVDDRRFRARFGLSATPLDAAARATVAWATVAHGDRARAVAARS